MQSHMGKAAGCICPTDESQGRVKAALHSAETGAAALLLWPLKSGCGCKISADHAGAL